MKLHIVRVRGTSAFPIDMLRYDRLSPETEADSLKIENSIIDMQGCDVRLVREAPERWKPAGGRWKSFGYRVELHVTR